MGIPFIGLSTSPLLCWRYGASMRNSQSPRGPLSLESCAEQAGEALACTYSNSAEYDAALIATRRAAGVYGPKRHRKHMLIAAAGIAAGLVVVAILVF